MNVFTLNINTCKEWKCRMEGCADSAYVHCWMSISTLCALQLSGATSLLRSFLLAAEGKSQHPAHLRSPFERQILNSRILFQSGKSVTDPFAGGAECFLSRPLWRYALIPDATCRTARLRNKRPHGGMSTFCVKLSAPQSL